MLLNSQSKLCVKSTGLLAEDWWFLRLHSAICYLLASLCVCVRLLFESKEASVHDSQGNLTQKHGN